MIGLLYFYDGGNFVHSSKYRINIIDRFGGGDLFTIDLIYSQLNNKDLQSSGEFGVNTVNSWRL
jgi:sugar/nucleoside kinase (ribokinase family)